MRRAAKATIDRTVPTRPAINQTGEAPARLPTAETIVGAAATRYTASVAATNTVKTTRRPTEPRVRPGEPMTAFDPFSASCVRVMLSTMLWRS